ncbi:hypothetical protein V8D89_011227 [Ganoderma adspersum]
MRHAPTPSDAKPSVMVGYACLAGRGRQVPSVSLSTLALSAMASVQDLAKVEATVTPYFYRGHDHHRERDRECGIVDRERERDSERDGRDGKRIEIDRGCTKPDFEHGGAEDCEDGTRVFAARAEALGLSHSV